MPTENTSLKNTTPAGDSNTSTKMVIGKINTYQRTFLIVASSILALFVVIAVASTSGGQHLQSSTHGIAKGAVALADYQVDSSKLALTNNIFGLDAVSENDKGYCNPPCDVPPCNNPDCPSYTNPCTDPWWCSSGAGYDDYYS